MGNRFFKKRTTSFARVSDHETERYSCSICHWEGMPVESWICSQFLEQEKQQVVLETICNALPKFRRVGHVRLLVASWNVGSVAAKGGLNKLSSSLRNSVVRILSTSFAEGEQSVKADIICLCLQGIVPLDSMKTWMKRHDSQYKSSDQEHTEVLAWVRIAKDALPLDPTDSWLLYGRPTYMCGLLSLLLVRRSGIRPLRSFGNADLPVDHFNIGTKGAVALCFRIHDTSVCVCNVHLQAHSGSKECTNLKALHERKKQIQEIRRGLSFQGDTHNAWRTMDDHHVVILSGDTNMQLEMAPGKQEVTTAHALHQISAGEKGWQELKSSKDQLTLLGGFDGLVEPSGENLGIFPPTFKLLPRGEEGSSRKATLSSEDANLSKRYNTKRVPAWTDRVLLRANSDNVAECVKYSSVIQEKILNHSVATDHDPVYAAFVIKSQEVDVDTLHRILEQAGVLQDVQDDLSNLSSCGASEASLASLKRNTPPKHDHHLAIDRARRNSLFKRQTSAQLTILLKCSVQQELDGGAGMTCSSLMVLKQRLRDLGINDNEQKHIEEDAEEEWLAAKMRPVVHEAREQAMKALEAELIHGVDAARGDVGATTSHRVANEIFIQALAGGIEPLSRRWTVPPPGATTVRREHSAAGISSNASTSTFASTIEMM